MRIVPATKPSGLPWTAAKRIGGIGVGSGRNSLTEKKSFSTRCAACQSKVEILQPAFCAAKTAHAHALYQLYLQQDASLVEINPLIVTGEGDLLALDAKINIEYCYSATPAAAKSGLMIVRVSNPAKALKVLNS